jgi:predicted negative regulator of RcsB-dependent stress response
MAKQDLYTAPKRVVTGAEVVDDLPSAEEKLKGVEHWYQDNHKMINNVVIGILAVVLGYVAYDKFYKTPRIEKSNDAIFRAQTYFGMDSLNWALNGDGDKLGFAKIIDKFSGTPAANLSKYYAGVCCLKMGDFAKAEKYLKDFDGKGTMVSDVAKGALGDALMEQNKTDDAIKAYLDASKNEDNLFLAPIYLERAGMAYEIKNNPTEAIKMYRKIKERFPMSQQARNMDKNLARLGDYNP